MMGKRVSLVAICGHLGIHKVLVSYEITRGIILVVGTVHDGFWVGLGGSGGVWGVQKGSTLPP